MTDDVKIIEQTTLAHAYGLLRRNVFDLRRRSGAWQRQQRETYDTGDGAAVLLHDPGAGTVVLVRQFRFPALYAGLPPYLVEVCAGKLDGDDPATCARREAEEETGYRVRELTLVSTCFASPGAVTERLTLFVGHYDATSRLSDGGGLHDEGEDIEVLELPLAAALAMIGSGEIIDMKTVVLLQHVALAARG